MKHKYLFHFYSHDLCSEFRMCECMCERVTPNLQLMGTKIKQIDSFQLYSQHKFVSFLLSSFLSFVLHSFSVYPILFLALYAPHKYTKYNCICECLMCRMYKYIHYTDYSHHNDE